MQVVYRQTMDSLQNPEFVANNQSINHSLCNQTTTQLFVDCGYHLGIYLLTQGITRFSPIESTIIIFMQHLFNSSSRRA